jgi:hypothetical protein
MCTVGARERGPVGMQRTAPPTQPDNNSHQPKRARKDRSPNWLPQEITALISAKRDMFLEELDSVDGRDLMNPDSSKWLRVSQHVMRADSRPTYVMAPHAKRNGIN